MYLHTQVSVQRLQDGMKICGAGMGIFKTGMGIFRAGMKIYLIYRLDGEKEELYK